MNWMCVWCGCVNIVNVWLGLYGYRNQLQNALYANLIAREIKKKHTIDGQCFSLNTQTRLFRTNERNFYEMYMYSWKHTKRINVFVYVCDLLQLLTRQIDTIPDKIEQNRSIAHTLTPPKKRKYNIINMKTTNKRWWLCCVAKWRLTTENERGPAVDNKRHNVLLIQQKTKRRKKIV